LNLDAVSLSPAPAALAALAAGAAAVLAFPAPRRIPGPAETDGRPGARRARRPERSRTRRAERLRSERIQAGLPVAVDLLAAVLRAGIPFGQALDMVARALVGPGGEELSTGAERLRLGAEPAGLWNQGGGRGDRASAPLVELGRALARAERSGAPLADLLDRLAADARRTAQTSAQARAQRTGVLVVLPLGLCFLPAFVLIGVVPMAAGLLTAFLSG
jgi:Flp pilus assembly protein TadB